MSAFSWSNPPPRWHEEEGLLRVTTAERTDFWSRTFYGFIRANGHFRHRPAAGDFTMAVKVAADYGTLYDQAGLMLRADAENWLKCGVEYTDGAMHFSTVLTRGGYSDWSMLVLPDAARESLSVRLTRQDNALRVHYRIGAEAWRAARLCTLEMPETVEAGMMCCTPERGGLTVTFRDFTLGPPISRELHGPE